MRTPTYRELKRFCEVEGWEDADARRGRPTGDHFRYRLELPNGDVLRTRVSHGNDEIGRDLFKRILPGELQVTEKEFSAAVDKRVRPIRAIAPEPPPGHRLPASVVEPLIRDFGLTDAELRGMSENEARQRLRELRRKPRRR